jgi:hypothetical protein
MSVSRACIVVERTPRQWFCVVAQDEYDYEFRDWRVYGPKPTADEARDEMGRHEANPGSHDTVAHDEITPRDKRLVDNMKHRYRGFGQFRL